MIKRNLLHLNAENIAIKRNLLHFIIPSSSDQQGEIQLDINKRKIRMKKIQICSKYKLKINAIIQLEIIIAIYIYY